MTPSRSPARLVMWILGLVGVALAESPGHAQLTVNGQSKKETSSPNYYYVKGYGTVTCPANGMWTITVKVERLDGNGDVVLQISSTPYSGTGTSNYDDGWRQARVGEPGGGVTSEDYRITVTGSVDVPGQGTQTFNPVTTTVRVTFPP